MVKAEKDRCVLTLRLKLETWHIVLNRIREVF